MKSNREREELRTSLIEALERPGDLLARARYITSLLQGAGAYDWAEDAANWVASVESDSDLYPIGSKQLEAYLKRNEDDLLRSYQEILDVLVIDLNEVKEEEWVLTYQDGETVWITASDNGGFFHSVSIRLIGTKMIQCPTFFTPIRVTVDQELDEAERALGAFMALRMDLLGEDEPSKILAQSFDLVRKRVTYSSPYSTEWIPGAKAQDDSFFEKCEPASLLVPGSEWRLVWQGGFRAVIMELIGGKPTRQLMLWGVESLDLRLRFVLETTAGIDLLPDDNDSTWRFESGAGDAISFDECGWRECN